MGLAAAAVVERREARAAEAAAKRARVEAAVARLQVSAGLATVRAKKQKKRLSSVASRVPARSMHQPQPIGQLVSKVTAYTLVFLACRACIAYPFTRSEYPCRSPVYPQ